MTIFADKLAQLRQKTKESLQDVADVVGASKAHVWELETGKSQNPSLELVRKLADHFKVSVAWLIGETPSDNTDPQAGALYRSLQTLSPQNKQHIQAIIDSMRKTEN